KVLPRVTLSGTSRYIIGANVPRPPRRAVAPQRRCQERPAKRSLPEEAPPMKIRRSLVTLLAAAVFGFAGAQELPTVRAAVEAAGTFSWIVHGMDYFGTAEANGIRVEGTVYASKQATELALRGAEADVTVDDFLGSVLLRSRDVAVSGIYPYAKAVGGLVVPVSSDIDSIDDLRGRTIAAGSLRDKSLLILRALAVSQYEFDPQDESEIVAAAPPLMVQLIADAEVDAALPFWHFVA